MVRNIYEKQHVKKLIAFCYVTLASLFLLIFLFISIFILFFPITGILMDHKINKAIQEKGRIVG